MPCFMVTALGPRKLLSARLDGRCDPGFWLGDRFKLMIRIGLLLTVGTFIHFCKCVVLFVLEVGL
jgi:hypothetical protein